MQQVPAGYDVIAADGAVLQLRLVRPEDGPALEDLFHRLSRRTAYQRFLSASPVAAAEYVASLSDPAQTLDAVLASSRGVVVAVGSIHEVTPATAEVAMVIDDAHQGQGVGTLLLEDLVARGRARGLRELVALTLRSNVQMLQVFRDLGLPLRTEPEGDTVGVTVDLQASSALEEALAHREAAAAAASVQRLLRPRSVVVLGTRGHRSDLGQQLLRRLRRSGFTGTVHAVNRCGDEEGPGPPPLPADLAVVAVAPGQELAAARSCAASGAGAIVVLGPAVEDNGHGAAAAARARELRRIGHEAGVRLLGPGSLGLVNTDPATGLDLTLLRQHPRAGRVGMASDAGPVTSRVLTQLRARGLGVSTVLDTGGSADVGPCDLLAFAAVDPRTTVAALCLHDIPDVAALTRAVTATRVPVLLLAGAPLGGPANHEVLEAWCRRTGVTPVSSPQELADTAALLVLQPAPPGRRVAVLCTSEEAGRRARRRCSELGLLPADLTQHTDARLRLLLPGAATVDEVVHTTGSVSPDQLRLALEALADDPGVDAVVVLVEPRFHLGPAAIQAVLEEVSAGQPHATVVSGVPLGAGRTSRTVPFTDDPDAAVTALASVMARQLLLRAPYLSLRSVPAPCPLHRLADLVVAEAMHEHPPGGWLPRREADDILRAYGVEVLPTVGADGPETAADASELLHFPVVLTAYGTEGGTLPRAVAVVDRLTSPAAVRGAARMVRDRLGAEVHTFDLQPQLHRGPSLAVTGVRRPGWGAMVGVGLCADPGPDPVDRVVPGAGPPAPASPAPASPAPDVPVEALRSRWALAPVGAAEATDLVRAVRMARGRSAPVRWSGEALRGLAAVLERLSVLLHEHPEVEHVDLCPVVLDGDHALVASARVLLAPPRTLEDHPLLLRRLHG